MKRQTLTLLGVGLVGGLLAVGCHTSKPAQPTHPVVVTPSGEIVVPEPPPAPRPENPSPAPAAYDVWIPGYWTWSDRQWVWVPGNWQAPPREGTTWVAGHWEHETRGWVWTPGHWE